MANMTDIFVGPDRDRPPSIVTGNFTNSSGTLDEYPYEEPIFTVDTASAQLILLLAAAAISLVKTTLASGAYSYFHPAMSVLSLAFLVTAFVVFRLNDYKEENELDEDSPESFYGDSLFLYFVTYITGCVVEVVNVLLTFKTVRIYYKMKGVFPEETRDGTKKTAANRTRCISVFGSIIPLLVPLLSFNKADWDTKKVLPYHFDQLDNQILLMGAFHAILAAFITFVATFVERQFTLVKVLGGVAQLLFLVKSGLAYIVLIHVDGRGAGGLTFLSLITTFQGIEFASEVPRLTEWFALADPPEEEEACAEEAPPEQSPELTERNTATDHHSDDGDPAFPNSNVATDNDTSFLESESLTIGTYSQEERNAASVVDEEAVVISSQNGSIEEVSAASPPPPPPPVCADQPSVSPAQEEVAASDTDAPSEMLEEEFETISLDVGDLYTMKQ